MTPEVKILRDALKEAGSELSGEGYDTGPIIDAFEAADKAKTEPSEDDKKRLRSVLAGLDNPAVKESDDMALQSLKWTTTELAKSWGME